LEPRTILAEVEDDFIVFLKASEEAICDGCKFNWIQTTLPILSSFSYLYDSTYEDYVLTLTGTGFTGTTSSVEFYIDDIA
jgi:hypothetical protein